MKYITKNLIFFTIGVGLLTLLFRFSLSSLIMENAHSKIWMYALGYGLSIAIIGLFFGKREYDDFPLNDVGFRFHLTTYIMCNGIAELWFLSGNTAPTETLSSLRSSELYWGLGLLLHFLIFILTRKNTIAGMDKSEIFE